MKAKYKVKYNDLENAIELNGVSISSDIVSVSYPNITENLSGFVIYNPDGSVLKDCSDFKHRWDILEDNPLTIYYSISSDIVQTEKINTENFFEDVEPLSNEALTECVGDLMYEVSLMQLGL